jgi:putative two-component system response regulator
MPDDIPQAHVLVVDDVPTNFALLARILEGYRVTTVASSHELFQALHGGLRPDLILLDIMMPDETGFAACARLKECEEWRDIPVIFVTGLTSPEDETIGLEKGAVDYIAKPLVPAVVRARVKTHLALASATRRLASESRTLEERLSERTVQLRDALRSLQEASHETIVRLARAAEYKDEDTGAHIVRMGQYGAAVARRLGLGEETAELLLRAAPMHDVGKIGVPDRVLLKRGRLDAEEFEIVKTHTELGARILAGSQSRIIQLGEVLAFAHHERLDGAGYPRGLKGDAIPLPARIVAVADTFDALVSRRPYKDPLPLDVSFEILGSLRGSAFDPCVVDAFLSIDTEIIEIVGTYRDVTPSPLFGGLATNPGPQSDDLVPGAARPGRDSRTVRRA